MRIFAFGGTEEDWAEAKREQTLNIEGVNGRFRISTADEQIGHCIFLRGECEYGKVKYMLEFLRSRNLIPEVGKGTMIDAGAHIGEVAISLLVRNEFERAIAVEPEPKNYELLCYNVEQNGLDGRIETHDCALSDREGEILLELNTVNTGDNRVCRSGKSDWPTTTVKTRTLDSIVAGRKIDLVWMDVQGHDGWAIKGGTELFSTGLPFVDEIWPYGVARSGMDLEEYIGLMQSHWPSFYFMGEVYGVAHFRPFVYNILADPDGNFRDVLLCG